MFTGIITAVGQIKSAQAKGDGLQLLLEVPAGYLDDVALGDSIAIQGACMTATQIKGNTFALDISRESLSKTVGLDRIGPVNLEKALRLNDRLGGHLVSGHVDGVGKVIDRKPDGRSIRFNIKAPDELAKYIAEKGSICINGISLTVNDVSGAVFSVNIVPHTLKETTLNDAALGTLVNLEVDLLARYMERLMKGEAAAKSGAGVTEMLLKNSGFFD